MASSIRLFISLVLYREKEKDKDKKIKANRKNIIDYLNEKDLWETKIYNDGKFENYLEKIKSINIKIKEILLLSQKIISKIIKIKTKMSHIQMNIILKKIFLIIM